MTDDLDEQAMIAAFETVMRRTVDPELRAKMQRTIDDIRSGKFREKWEEFLRQGGGDA